MKLPASAGLLFLLSVVACVDYSLLSGKRCDDQGQCLEGYRCDPATHRCMRADQTEDGGLQPDGDSLTTDGDTEPEPVPIVLYTFEQIPNPPLVPDESDRLPNVKLQADNRDPQGVEFNDGAAVFSGGRLQATPGASKNLADALVEAGSFSVVAWAATDRFEQTGPDRLVTLSSGAHTRAFTLGQEGENLVARLRTSISDENGRDHELWIPVFVRTEPRHLVFVYDGSTGAHSVYVDAQLRQVFVHVDDQEVPATLNWDTSRERLGLGDEFDAERRWTGSLHRVAIYDRALDAALIRAMYQAGP